MGRLAIGLASVVALVFLLGPVVGGPMGPRPYDVTVSVPGEGIKTIVISSHNWEFRDGCFISKSPEPFVLCNVLQVKVCTEECSPPKVDEAPPSPAPPPAGQKKPSSMARN